MHGNITEFGRNIGIAQINADHFSVGSEIIFFTPALIQRIRFVISYMVYLLYTEVSDID